MRATCPGAGTPVPVSLAGLTGTGAGRTGAGRTKGVPRSAADEDPVADVNEPGGPVRHVER